MTFLYFHSRGFRTSKARLSSIRRFKINNFFLEFFWFFFFYILWSFLTVFLFINGNITNFTLHYSNISLFFFSRLKLSRCQNPKSIRSFKNLNRFNKGLLFFKAFLYVFQSKVRAKSCKVFEHKYLNKCKYFNTI